MALQPHPRSTVQQSRAHGSPHHLLDTDASGPDDDPSTNEGRGTPHEPTEGLEPSSCRSDHSNPHHTTLVLSYRVSEPKGGIGVLDKPSSPGSVWEGATPAGMLSAELPASSPPTEALTDPKGSGLTVAAIRPAAVNSRRDASSTQQRYESTELGRTPDEALGAREPAQNLGVSPPPSPLLAAAGQPPAPVPLPQSGAPGARNYLDIILSPAPTRPSSPAPPSALPSVELPSLQSAVSRDPPFGVVAEAAAAGRPDNYAHAFPSPGNGACRAGSRAGSDSEFSAPVEPPAGMPPETLRSPLRLRMTPRPKQLPLVLPPRSSRSTASLPTARRLLLARARRLRHALPCRPTRQPARLPTLRSPLRLRMTSRPKLLPLPLLCQPATTSTPVCRPPMSFWM